MYKEQNKSDWFFNTITEEQVSPHSSKYQDWLAQGNTPDPADVVDPMIAIRAERDRLCDLLDNEINDLEDHGLDASVQRARRIKLRNVPQNFPNADIATFDWSAI